MKKALKITKKVLTWLLVILTVLMTLITIASATIFNKTDASIFGLRMYVVLSDSMSATDFSAGDLIISKEVEPEELVEGDIITFTSTNRESMGQTVTHKIRSRTTLENGELGFITYGTTNGVDDVTPARAEHVHGKYVGRIPYVGTFCEFLKTPLGYLLCIFVPFLILIALQIKNCAKAFRHLRKEQKAEMQTERDELKAEREKLEEALAQMRAMQAQMSATQAAPAAPPAEETPAEAPVVEAPVVEAPVVEAPAEAPVEETPAEEASTEETPTEETPAEE